MSDDPHLQQHPPQQQHTPIPSLPGSTPEPVKNKRARPTISCLECRRKKLKCDRVQPCMQCTKSGRQSLCTFASGTPAKNPIDVDSIEAGRRTKRPKVDSPGQAVGHGDWGVNAHWGNGWAPANIFEPPIERSEPSKSSAYPKSSLGRIFVKGDRCRFLGLGDRISMLHHFEDAKTFIMTASGCSDMKDIMQELSAVQKTLQVKQLFSATHTPPSALSLGRPGIIASMLTSFPSDAYCLALKGVYEMYWESFIRILSRNSLDTSCFELWNARQEGVFSLPPSVKESIVPQMLSTLALSARLLNRSFPEADRVSEEHIVKSAHLIQRWVDDLKGKEKLNIEGLKVQVLLLLINQSNLASPAELWRQSGSVVRIAMIMGLHHDPEEYPEFSPYEKEQRRKLWTSIVELDIQFSLATGMPAAIRSNDFNLRSLLNIDDRDLTEEMTAYPPEKPLHEWTDSIAQIALGQSLKERLDAANMLGGTIDLEQDAAAILARAAALERHLHLLPAPIRIGSASGLSHDKSPGRLFAKIMLDVLIRRPSLYLYRTIALSPLSHRYPEARRAAVKSSIAILSHLDALDPTVADLSTIKDRDLLNHFHIMCKNDILQAAIMLCVEIQRFSLGSADTHGDIRVVQDEVPWTKHSLTRIVENTLNSFIQRLGELGSDLKDILPLSIVLQSVRSNGTLEEKRALMRGGAERIITAGRKLSSENRTYATLPTVSTSNNTDQNADVSSSSTQPLMFYCTSNTDSNAVSCDNQGRPVIYGDKKVMGGEIDFQDFDFGLTDWDWDLGYPVTMS